MPENKPEKIFDFGTIYRAKFNSRPNRFLVYATLKNGRTVKAFMPNPGRLQELLFPNAVLYLERNHQPERATKYTVLAVERDGKPIFLHTHLINKVARHLIEHGRVPGLEDCTIVRSEVPVGHSRFDFLLERDGQPLYLEVKSCTLFGNRVAMFPDAITERGRRHLEELAAMSQEGHLVSVMLVVHSPDIDWFMPDFHTDIEFSKTFLKVRHDVPILPVSVGWTRSLELMRGTRLLDIPWEHIEHEVQDRGAYIMLLKMKSKKSIEVGKLGKISFEKGWYAYIGSARKNLMSRINRHMRQRKRMHWHIDWLRKVADEVIPLPIRSSADLECKIAANVAKILKPGFKGFGSSDCKCDGHLFFSTTNPVNMPIFHEVLQKYRMRQPE